MRFLYGGPRARIETLWRTADDPPVAALPRQHAIGRNSMLDFAMIALAVASFALAIGYVAVCDRL